MQSTYLTKLIYKIKNIKNKNPSSILPKGKKIMSAFKRVEMGQQDGSVVEELGAKTDNLSSIPGAHMVMGEN